MARGLNCGLLLSMSVGRRRRLRNRSSIVARGFDYSSRVACRISFFFFFANGGKLRVCVIDSGIIDRVEMTGNI